MSVLIDRTNKGRERARIGRVFALMQGGVALLAAAALSTGEARAQGAPAPDARQEASPEAPDDAAGPGDDGAIQVDAQRTITLAEAREMVRTSNYDVQIARTQVQIAQAGIRQAWSVVHPQLSASGSYTINQEEITFSIEPDTPGFPGGEFPEQVVVPRTDYRWSLNASLQVNFRSYPLIRQARAQRALAEARVGLVGENLDQLVVQTYYDLLSVRRMIDVVARQLESNATMLRAAEARRAAETATEFEVTRARLRVVQSERDLERARLQFVQVREVLAELIQQPADFDVALPASAPAPADPDALRERAEQNRAVLRVNRVEASIAELGVQELYFRFLPAFAVTFSYAGTPSTILNPGEPRWMLTLSGEWMLWDGGARYAELDAQRARLVALDLQRRQARLQLASSINRAHAEYLSARSQVGAAQVQVELARTVLQQAETGYFHGVATQLDVINAQDQYELAQLALIQDQLQLEFAIQRLEQLAGGL